MAKKKTEVEKKEIAHGMLIRMNADKMNYIRNILNGRHYYARCNMIVEQLNSGNIIEKIDGCTKSKEYLRAEYGLMKMQAMNGYRDAHFLKHGLMKEFKLTEEDIAAFEEDYYNGKIIKEEYDESFNPKSKAEFIDSAEN